MKLAPDDPLDKYSNVIPVTVFEVDHSLENIAATAEALRSHGCVLFEWLGGTRAERELATDYINAISEGQYSEEELQAFLGSTDNFIFHLANALRGEDILFLPIDTAEDEESPAWQERQIEASMEEVHGNLEEAVRAEGMTVQALARYIAQRARAQVSREGHMALDIERCLAKINRNPRLRAKFRSVAVVVGAAHTGIYDDLYGSNPAVMRVQIP